MGAATALYLAALFPELPGSIILEDPPAFWMIAETTHQDDFQIRFTAWITSLKRKTRDELISECRAQNPGWSETEVGPWADSKHRFSLKITALLQSRLDSAEADAAILHQVTCPTLLITADPSKGAILGNTEVDSLKTLIPHLQHVHIPNAGHNIHRDQFKHYMDVLKNLLVQAW
jgi:pimeloyl-ACP methyl ester carboxylesterase